MNPLLPSILAALAFTMVAEARETGNIYGEVLDDGGLPVPNAEVVLSGSELAGEKTTTTREDGTFRFDGLPPGTYELSVSFDGALVAKAEVHVSLETTTRATIPTKIGGTAEEIEVIGLRPAVDTTQTAFSTSLDESAIQNLPVGRSYQDVVNTIPGVTGRIDTSEGGGGDGNPSVRGEGQYGNNFLIDGVSTRDPATKTYGMNVNFDAIEQVQVYTDGAPAEFGQFTGMVVNVVTKDGGDEHHGSAAVFYSQNAWFNSEYLIFDPDPKVLKEVDTTKAKFRSPSFSGTAGGPLVKEKLWYFAALDLSHDTLLPEGLKDTEKGLAYGNNAINLSGGQFMGKLTFFPTSALTLRYIFQGNLSVQLKEDAGQLVAPEAVSDRRDFSQSHLLTGTLGDDKNTLELRAGYTNINIDVVPHSGTSDKDMAVASRVDAQSKLWDNALEADYNDRNRYGGGFTYTRFLQNLAGDHKLRTGAEYWLLIDQRDLQHTGADKIEWIDPSGNPTGDQVNVGTEYRANPDLGYDCSEPDYSDCGVREHWTNVGPLGNKVHTVFFFLQDDWQISKKFNVNAGVRVDMEDGRNDKGKRPTTQKVKDFTKDPDSRKTGKYGPIIMPAPRVGMSIDPWGDGKTKIAGHYGQYYDLAGANLWSWSNQRSASSFMRYVRDADGEWQWSNTQDAAAFPLIYAEDLKPARLDKINVGVEREIGDTGVAVGIRGILSHTGNIPEDVDVNLDDWYIMNQPYKERNYRALELTVSKQFDDVWQVFGSYTLQESYGHTPGQFELDPAVGSGSDGNNVGVYMDDVGERETREFFYDNGLGWILDGFKGLGRYSVTEKGFYDEAGWYGYLPYHSFHAIKLNGSYTAPFGTTFGLVYEFDSGHAWQKKTFVPFYGFDSFGQGRGSRFMPAVHYVDVRVAHMIGLGTEDRSLELTLDVFNLPGFAQSITYFNNDTEGFGSTLYRQSPRSIRGGLKFRY